MSRMVSDNMGYKNNTSLHFDNNVYEMWDHFNIKEIVEYIPNYNNKELLVK